MAYILTSQLGNFSFAIEIVGYEFPDGLNDLQDSNWLVVRLSASTPSGRWSAQHPCLLTWEVEELITWLRGGYSLEPLLQFIEPLMQFHAVDSQGEPIHLQVTLQRELLPIWSDKEACLDLYVSAKELSELAQDLEIELSRYPYRQPMSAQ